LGACWALWLFPAVAHLRSDAAAGKTAGNRRKKRAEKRKKKEEGDGGAASDGRKRRFRSTLGWIMVELPLGEKGKKKGGEKRFTEKERRCTAAGGKLLAIHAQA